MMSSEKSKPGSGSGSASQPGSGSGSQPAAGEPRLPQSTSLFRALNFELFVKPNKVVMIAGLITFTFCVSYIAYINATAENRKDMYMAMNERGKLEKRQRASRWE
jgi:hypothetical protein